MNVITAALPDEVALVAQATVEPAAFAAIYDHYFPRVYNYVRYRVGDAQVADDLTSQAFERALVKINGYQPARGSFATWLFAIVRNAVNDYIRTQKRYSWLRLEALHGKASSKPAPEESVIEDETRAELLKAMDRLNERERDLIALKFAAGLTNCRIANLTGLTPSNVGVVLYRAVQQLRLELSVKE